MSKNVKVYNADEIDILFGSVIIDSGLADGEFLTIEQEADDTEDVVGVDGEVCVSRTNDRRANITIKLMQTSDGNDALSILSLLVRNSPGMAGGVLPFTVQDKNGRAKFVAANAWVVRAPDRTFDRTAQTVEWKLRAAHLDRFDGGN